MALWIMLVPFVVLVSFTTGGAAFQAIQRRTIQTSAVCSNDFAWMDNKRNTSPCLVAAYVNAACRSGVYDVPALPAQSHYDVLDPDLCSCSWASYNLLSACTACQGQEASIQNWALIRDTNCSKLQLNTYLPPNTPIGDGQTIPSWAGKNPTEWQDGRFNVDQAQAIANQDQPDLGSPSSPAPDKKSTPVGAIVGGVVGGVAVIALGVIAAVYMRNRHRGLQGGASIQDVLRRPPHTRSISDLSQKTGTSHHGYNFGQPPLSPTAPTIRTHSSSTHSLSYFGSAQGSVFSMPLQSVNRVTSGVGLPPGASPPAQQYPQDIITPFVSGTSPPPPTSPSTMHRKLASESSDTTIPVNRADEGSVVGTHVIVSTRRLNPPAYTPSVYASQSQPGQPHTPNLSSSELSAALRREARGHAHRPIRENKGSQDSQTTWDSAGSRNISQDPGPLANRIAMSLAGRNRVATPADGPDDDDHDDLPLA